MDAPALAGSAASAIVAAHPEPILLISASGAVLCANPAADRALVEGGPLADFRQPLAGALAQQMREAAGSSVWLPLRLPEPDDRSTPPDLKARGLMVPGESRPCVLVVGAPGRRRDPFERLTHRVETLNRQLAIQRRTEDELRAAVAQAGRLHQELIHRVKNNLAVLSSVVRGSARATDNPEVAVALRDVSARLAAIALIHEELDRQQRIETVNAREMIDLLVRRIGDSIAAPGITLETDVVDADLDMATAQPLGLLINEVLTNALKHAFRGLAAGAVRVHLDRDGTVWRLVISDDGIGMPPTPRRSGTGTAIIEALAGQLGGRIAVTSGAGTVWRLTFPVSGVDPAAAEPASAS